MRLDDTLVTHLSRKPARVARWIVIFAPLWMIFGSVALGMLGVPGQFVFLNLFVSFVSFLISAVTALAFRGGTELGVLREGTKASLSVATGGTLARIGDRELADRVTAGVRERVAGIDQVVLDLQSGDSMVVRVRDEKEADALLDAAGVGAHQRAVALRIGSVHTRLIRAFLGSLYLLGLLVGIPAGLTLLVTVLSELKHLSGHTLWFFEASAVASAVAWGTVFLCARFLAVRVIRIGHDGVLVQSGRFSNVFLPFEGLKVRRGGSRIGLRTGERTARIRASSDDEAALLLWHIERAQAARAHRDQLGASVLARNGRSLDAWRAELAALAEEQGYRAALGRGELVAVAEDPRAPSDQRVGATYALATLPKDAPERERLRVAIETTANPKLRVALEHAAAGTIDDEALEAADMLKNS